LTGTPWTLSMGGEEFMRRNRLVRRFRRAATDAKAARLAAAGAKSPGGEGALSKIVGELWSKPSCGVRKKP
jgi:hypothetical protein